MKNNQKNEENHVSNEWIFFTSVWSLRQSDENKLYGM